MHREAVLEAVRAARILSDVAADRTHLLARRIRCVVIAEWSDLACDLEVGDARLHNDTLIGDVDVDHTSEPRERDDDAAGDWKRAAGETRTVAACDERHAGAGRGADDRLHLSRRRG